MDDQESRVRSILGRSRPLFHFDRSAHEDLLAEQIRDRSFLVLGGAGTIGQSVVEQLFRRSPRRLHVVDASENNLVELVRHLRSSLGYIEGDFRTLPLDCGGLELECFRRQTQPYDVVLNFMAMKHVRSEKDPYSLMRMIRTNVLLTETTLQWARAMGAERYFAVSSDKAANPANAMGATKRVMELCLQRASRHVTVSSARFANVAFSDGSLLHGFGLRLAKRQPLSAPCDVRRYFLTAGEAGVLCLMASLLTESREVMFPAPPDDFPALSFQGIAERYLHAQGLRAHPCDTEDEARARVEELASEGRWPCYFFSSDTTGEKPVEEFTMAGETVLRDRFQEIGVIQWPASFDAGPLQEFLATIEGLRRSGSWTRRELLDTLLQLLPEFEHHETGTFLDGKM